VGPEEAADHLLRRCLQQGWPGIHGLFQRDGTRTETEDGIDPDPVEVGDALPNPAGDGQTGDAPRLGPLGNRGRGLAEGGLGIDLTLAGDGQIGPSQLGIELDQVQNKVRAAAQFGAEEGVQPSSQSAGGPGPGQIADVQAEIGPDHGRQVGKTFLQLLDLGGGCTLLRAIDPCRTPQSQLRARLPAPGRPLRNAAYRSGYSVTRT